MTTSEIITTKQALEIEPEVLTEEDDKVYDNLDEFQMALARASSDGTDYIIVSDRLMRFLSKDENIRSITYGKPAVRVYRLGTKDQIDHEESMGVDEYHALQVGIAKKKFDEIQAKKKRRKL